MIFSFNFKDLNIIKHYNTYGIFFNIDKFNSTIRFGDFIAIITFLFFVKLHLIKTSNGILNNDNFKFFIYSKNLNLFDINGLCRLYFNKLCQFSSTYNDKYSLNNVIKPFNIQCFFELLKKLNFKLDSRLSIYYTKQHIVNINNIKKNDESVVIFPVVNKKYNIERNQNTDTVIETLKVIKTYCSFKYNDIYIINKDNQNINNIDIKYLRKKYSVKIVEENLTQNDVVNFILSKAILFVSGDCGLTHLISKIGNKYRPNILLNQKTIPYKIKHKDVVNLSKIVNVNLHNIINYVNFIPYFPYQKSRFLVYR